MYRLKPWHSLNEDITVQTDENGNIVQVDLEIAQTISSEQFDSFLDLCFSEATTFSLQKGLWANFDDKSLEEVLEPYKIQTINTKKWFENDISNAPPGSEWTMCILMYTACNETKAIIKKFFKDIFLGYAGTNTEPCKYTLEDLSFFKSKELIVGTISHELILHVYPPNKSFEQSILPLGEWEYLEYKAPILL